MSTNREAVSRLFGDYRAEWSQPEFASLFTPPPYLVKLENNRPCFLVGGRGTGKTTTLRSLRFDAASIRSRTGESGAVALPYFGIYVRINKNRVRAFTITELDANTRQRAFAHYFNILTCIELCQLSSWLELQDPTAQRVDVAAVAATFGLRAVTDTRSLQAALLSELTELELYVNNGGRTAPPVMSVLICTES